MYLKRKNIVLYIVSMLFILTSASSCSIPLKGITPNNIDTELVLANCIKTWKIIDYTADTIFKVMGELYSQGKITNDQLKPIITEGDILRTNLINTKNEIMAYLWEKEYGVDKNIQVSKILHLVDIVHNTIRAYYQLKNVTDTVYEQATGGKLYTPDIPLIEIK